MSGQDLKDQLASTGYFKKYRYKNDRNESGNFSDHDTATLYYGFRLRDSFAKDEIKALTDSNQSLRDQVKVLREGLENLAGNWWPPESTVIVAKAALAKADQIEKEGE